ncbi:unnamed protein product, partial [Nesidiocoris tenuis]
MKKSWDKQIDELATDFMQRLDGIYLGGPAESKSNETQPEGRDRREQEDSEAIGDSTGDDPSTGQPSTVGDECVPKQTPSNKNAKKTRTIVAEKRPTWDELVTEEEEKRSWLNEKNQKSLRGRSSISTCPARRERSNNHETVKRGPSFASAMNKPRKVLKLRKVPFKAAVKAAKQRRRTGRANLVIYTDSDTESLPSDKRMCWVDDEVEDEVAMYANNREKDGDSDDQGHPKRAALSSFD